MGIKNKEECILYSFFYILLNNVKKILQVNFEINDTIFGIVLLHRDHRISSARNVSDRRPAVFDRIGSKYP